MACEAKIKEWTVSSHGQVLRGRTRNVQRDNVTGVEYLQVMFCLDRN